MAKLGNKERLQQVLAASSDAYWDWDLRTGAMFVSPRWFSMLGYAPGEIRLDPETLNRLVHPGDLAGVLAAVNGVIDGSAGADHYEVQHRYRTTSGRYIWVTARGHVVGRDARGRATALSGTVTDITTRKAAEDALRESEARFRGTFENAAVGMSHMDLDGTWLCVNQRLCDMVGYTREELLQKTFPDITYVDDLAADLVQFERLRRGEIDAYQMEKRYVHRDGHIVWISLSVARQPGERYCICVIEDITARKQAELALRELNQDLERRVAARTAQVQALAGASVRAEARERRRISQVLHDELQQLLYSELMRLEMLRQLLAVNPDTVPSQLDGMAALMNRAIQLTRDLVVELNPPALQSEQFEEALRWLVERVQALHGLQVQLHVEGACAVPDLDLRELLLQTVRELLFNVVKHAGTGRARLALAREDERVVLCVEDEGPGFDVEAARDRTRKDGGTGLFSIGERLALVGGHLEIDSAPARGTRVTVVVPCHDVGRIANPTGGNTIPTIRWD